MIFKIFFNVVHKNLLLFIAVYNSYFYFYFIMFMGLKKPLKEGKKVPVTLKFKNAKPQTVQLEVKTAPQSGMDHGHGHDHGGAHQH